ncbi:MAG: lysophospholipid acyltransferase family protein [Alphaproteobacteria bacterium]
MALKKLGYLAQGLLALALYALLLLMSLKAASRLSSWLFRCLGRRSSLSRRARRQLAWALPDLTQARVEAIISGMWDNIGFICAEYVHLPKLVAQGQPAQLVGGEYLAAAANGQPILLISAHLANWEVATLAAQRRGLQPAVVYRHFNNPIIERYARRTQAVTGAELIPKSAAGTRRIVEKVAAGGQVILLVDQRLNSGVSVPFFGRPAMTAPAVAKLAYRFGALIVPVRVERLGIANFRATIEPAIELPDTGDRAADIRQVMTAVNARFEVWIGERPEQWLWLHRRWKEGQD